MPFSKNKIAFYPTQLAIGDRFYGRSQEMLLALELLSNSQSVLVTGETRIGKSSFLSELKRRIEHEFKHRIVAKIDAFAVSSIDDFVRRLTLEIAGKGTESIEHLKYLLETADHPVLIIIDEFDSFLHNTGGKAGLLVKAIIDSGHSVFCVASRYSQNHVDSETSRLFPVFNLFYEIPLAGFTTKEAKEFLFDASQKSGEIFSTSEVDFIISFIGLIPIHLQHLGFRLFSESGFIGSSDGRRLAYFSNAIEEFTMTNLLSTLARFKDDPALRPEHLTYLQNLANGKPLIENDIFLYLKKRGFLSENENPFSAQGMLFREVLRAVPIDVKSKMNSSSGIIGNMVKGAISTAVNTAVKNLLS